MTLSSTLLNDRKWSGSRLAACSFRRRHEEWHRLGGKPTFPPAQCIMENQAE